MGSLATLEGGSCTKNMTSTGGCSYSFVYSWWWVWLTPETCRVNMQNNRLLCVTSCWTVINIHVLYFSEADKVKLKLTQCTLWRHVGVGAIAIYIINLTVVYRGEGSAAFPNHFMPLDEAVWACWQVSWVGSRFGLDNCWDLSYAFLVV